MLPTRLLAICDCTFCRAERYETSVERLVWLPAYSPQQRQAAAATAKALAASAASLAGIPASYSHSGFFAEADDSNRRRLVAQESSASSNVPLVVVPSMMSVHSEKSVIAGARQQPQSAASGDTRMKHHTAAATGAAGSGGSGSGSGGKYDADAVGDTSGVSGLEAADATDEPPDAVLLLSAGGDGVIRVWLINILGQGQLLCTLPGKQVEGLKNCMLPG